MPLSCPTPVPQGRGRSQRQHPTSAALPSSTSSLQPPVLVPCSVRGLPLPPLHWTSAPVLAQLDPSCHSLLGPQGTRSQPPPALKTMSTCSPKPPAGPLWAHLASTVFLRLLEPSPSLRPILLPLPGLACQGRSPHSCVSGAQWAPAALTLLRWWWDGRQDQLQLVERGCAREQGPPPQHLPQDATQTPHVHPRGVPEVGRVEVWGTLEAEVGMGRGTRQGVGSEVLGGGGAEQLWEPWLGQKACWGVEGGVTVTSLRIAAPQEPGTSVWPRTLSGPGPRAPQ